MVSTQSPRDRAKYVVIGALLLCGLIVVATSFHSAPDTSGKMTNAAGDITSKSDQRSNQGAGESTQAIHGPITVQGNPVTADQPQDVNGNARRIDQSTEPLKLTAEQQQEIRALISRIPGPARVKGQPFTISVGAAVPRQVPLQRLPSDLTSVLKGFENDNYVLVGSQLVIVDANVRRVVAIVPNAT
jgi:hypothetical protein